MRWFNEEPGSQGDCMHHIIDPVDERELEPMVLAQVTEVTGCAGDGGGDIENIVWGTLSPAPRV